MKTLLALLILLSATAKGQMIFKTDSLRWVKVELRDTSVVKIFMFVNDKIEKVDVYKVSTKEIVQVPCPEGMPGCLVFHTGSRERIIGLYDNKWRKVSQIVIYQ